MESKKLNIIKSAYKVFDVLETIVQHKKLSINEISNLTQHTKSTTQRIVNTLKDLQYIIQDDVSLKYFPSSKLYELGNQVVGDIPIKNISKPHLLKLYNEINETINLAVLNGKDVIYLDKLVSTSPLKVELELGVKVPIYCSALGKSIAAFSDIVYSFEGEYIKYTNNTISSDKELHKELKNIRKLGYAVDREEYVEGLICISVPIFNKKNDPIASISISKPTVRFNNEDIEYYVTLLKNSSNKIESKLYL